MTQRTIVRMIAALTGFLLLAGAAACSAEQLRTADGKIILTELDYYTDEPSHSQMGERLNRCAARFDAVVQQQSVPSPQLNAKILQQVATDTLPDIMMVNNPDLPQFARTGALTPLTETGVDTDGYFPSALSVGRYQDRLYGLAPTVNSLELFYNKDLLDQAGLDVPRTWDELADTAAALTTKDRYGFAYSAASGTEGTWTFIPFLWSNGGSQLKLTDPEAVQALDYYTGLARKGSVSRSVVNWAQADAADQFTAGKAAMMINGPWQIPSLQENSDLNWGTAAIPVPQRGRPSVAPLGGEVWTVPKNDRGHQRVAQQVVGCLNEPAQQLATARTNQTVPSNRRAARQLAQEQPEMATIVRTVGEARSLTSDSGLAWNAVNQSLSTAIQSAVIEKETPAEALAIAQSSIEGAGS